MRRLGFVLLLAALGCGGPPEEASEGGAPALVLQNATIIDGTGNPPIPGGTIVISDGQIQSVGPSAEVTVPAGAQTVDLSGKTIIPGIINAHGHLGMTKGLVQDMANYTRENAQAQLDLYAQYGVTTTTSMGSDNPEVILAIRGDQRNGMIEGARIFTAVKGFTTVKGYPTMVPGMQGVPYEAGTPEEARAGVDELASEGADLVKIWVDDHHDREPKITPEVYGAVIDQAHKHNLRVAAHVYELADARGLVAAGVDILAHSVRDAEIDDALIDAMKQNDVTYVATLSREQSTYSYADSPAWLDDPFFTKGTTPEIIEQVKTKVSQTQAADPDREINIKGFEMALRNLKKLSDAGVRVALGTDTGPPGRFSGYFEHWEMELMVQAGLTPMQVIQAFSRNAAEALGASDRLGSLTAGHAADLVVLTENPLENIGNTRTIEAVYIAGRQVE